MSEAVEGYARDRFPYYEILSELTHTVKAEGMSPVWAYEEFLRERDAAELTPYFDYASTSRTTGGHARVPGNDMNTVVGSNTQTARDVVSVLDAQGSIEGREVLLPADLGHTGWRQSGYMTFWSLVIAGRDVRRMGSDMLSRIRFENALEFRMREAGVEFSVMDSNLELETRRPVYFKFVKAFAGLMRDIDLPSLPAHRLISLADNRISLECTAECLLADELAIPRQRVVVTGPTQTAEDALPSERLRQDIKIISAYGGQIMVAQADARLALTRDEEPVIS